MSSKRTHPDPTPRQSRPRGATPAPSRRVALAAKRGLDAAAATVLIVALSPLLALAAVAVYLTMGPPVFFVQERPGLRARPFRLVKFRTMHDAVDPDGQPLPDAVRLPRVGRLLRRTSVDELPQLWNVLRGELSLVGPRPLLMEYLPRYTREQMRRHDVKPGITGWSQVNGRNLVGWEERFALDVWYVDHWSLWLDLRILARTVVTVLRREGVSAVGEATMSPYQGSPGRRT